MSSLYGRNRLGQGFGADLGFTYEWRPGHEAYQYPMDGWEWTAPNRNKYRLRLGLAVTDLGTIRYANAAYVRQAVLASTRTVRLGQLDTLHFKTLQSVGTTVDKLGSLHQMHSWRFLVEFRKSRVPLGE